MLDRADDKRTERKARRAANARRYRGRFNRGQAVFRAVADTGHLTRLLIREGYLVGGLETYEHSAIEQALTLFIDDDPTRKYRH